MVDYRLRKIIYDALGIETPEEFRIRKLKELLRAQIKDRIETEDKWTRNELSFIDSVCVDLNGPHI